MTREEEIRQAAINHICDDTEQLLVLFEEGAKWADKTMIDKACEWMKNTIDDDVFINCGAVIKFMSANEFVEYFRKAMEEK